MTFTLVAFHAHPDGEALLAADTPARAAAGRIADAVGDQARGHSSHRAPRFGRLTPRERR